jgi:uncharacterized protein YutE (UPF0331/DUF86 family)
LRIFSRIGNKASVIERCLQRVEDEYEGDPANLRDDITRQDAIILNLQRACQAAIDLAMHLVREHGLGVPQESREAFALLDDAGHLDTELSDRLQRMVGFRNVAVHDYQDLNLDIVQSIVEEHLSDFTTFTEQVVTTDGFRSND